MSIHQLAYLSSARPQMPQRELEQLSEQLRYHERQYRDGAPEITDAAFDDMVERYGALADQLGLGESERIDAKPGADHTEGFQTVQHRGRRRGFTLRVERVHHL